MMGVTHIQECSICNVLRRVQGLLDSREQTGRFGARI
jgi:hypothetical protein